MKVVTVAAFNSREEAEPLRARLEEAGIPAAIHNELLPVEAEAFARPSAGVRLEVSRERFEEALQLVYDWNAAGVGGLQAPLEWLAPRADGASPARDSRRDPGR